MSEIVSINAGQGVSGMQQAAVTVTSIRLPSLNDIRNISSQRMPPSLSPPTAPFNPQSVVSATTSLAVYPSIVASSSRDERHSPLFSPVVTRVSPLPILPSRQRENATSSERYFFSPERPLRVAKNPDTIAIQKSIRPPGEKQTAVASRPLTSSQALRLCKKMSNGQPHITQRIFHETVKLYRRSLQGLIGKIAYTNRDIAMLYEAIRHFIVRENPSQAKLIAAKIDASSQLSAADKAVLHGHIRRALQARTTAVCPPPCRVMLPKLAGALSHDLIEMLIKFGATTAEIDNFLRVNSTTSDIINGNLLDISHSELDVDLDLSADNDAMLDKLFAITQTLNGFNRALRDISRYLTRQHSDRDAIRDNALSQRETSLLKFNFLRGLALSDLFKAVIKHLPVLMVRSLINPEQLDLLTGNHSLFRLKKMFSDHYRFRAECLFNRMVIAPFIFGDSQQPPVFEYSGLAYGYRGLSFTAIDHLISDETLSPLRLSYIGLYSNDRLAEITTRGELDLTWIASLSDETLARLFTPRHDPTRHEGDQHEFVLADALRTIGKIVVKPDYDYPDLPALLTWVREQAGLDKQQASDNHLAYLLFAVTPADQRSLPAIAADIQHIQQFPQSAATSLALLMAQVSRFIRQTITPQTLRAMQLCDQRITQLNTLLRPEKILRIVAQRFTTPILVEDTFGDFQHHFDSAGRRHSQPPNKRETAIIMRPGMLVPLDSHGTQQPTIVLEPADNHNLLKQLVKVLTTQQRLPLTDGELEQQVDILVSKLLAATNS